MSISTLTSAERWKNHGLIGEVQQKFEKQINGNSAFTMNDNLQIEYEGTQATTQKAKETLKKLSGLYAVLNEIQGLNSVATADMLTEDIYIKCKKDYGISKKELQRLISDAQNGLVPQLQYKSAYDGHELERGKHYFAVEAAKERVHAEGDNGEQMKNKVTIHQNMEGAFDGIWKTEAEMDASSFINKIRSEKKETRKNGIAFIEERVTRLREEQRVRPFQKVTLPQADIVQCKKVYNLSKKEVEKIAIEIQSKTGVAALENNTEQDKTTETAEVNAAEVNAAEVNAAEVNAEEVNAEEVNAEEVNAAEVNAAEVNAEEVNAAEVNAEEVNAGEVHAAEVNAEEVNAGEVHAAEVNAEEVNAAEVHAAEVNAGEVNAQEVNTEEEMVLQDILHFDVERFMERQEAKDYKWFRTISAYLLKRIDNTTPQVEVLAIREHAKEIILKRYKLTEEYLRNRYRAANKKREDLELLAVGTAPWDIREEYRIRELKLTSITGQEKMFEKAKEERLGGTFASGMKSEVFYDMHQYKKSFDLLAREQKKLSEMQALFEERSKYYKEKRRENGGVAIPDTEKSIFEAQEKVRALENSVARLRDIAEKREKAFKKHEGYGDFSLKKINSLYGQEVKKGPKSAQEEAIAMQKRMGANYVAERAEAVEVANREHIKFKKDYAAAVANRMNAVRKEYNYPEDQEEQKEAAIKIEAAFKKASEEFEAAKSSLKRNEDDFYIALYMCKGEV